MELASLKRRIDATYVARGGVLRDENAVAAFLVAVDVEPDDHTIARFLNALRRSNSLVASPRGDEFSAMGRSLQVSSRNNGGGGAHAARQGRELVSVDDCVEIAKQCLEVQHRKSVGGNDTHYLHLAWAGCGGDESRRGVIEREVLEQQLRQFGVGLPPDVVATSDASGGAGYDDEQPATMDFEDVVALVSVSKALLHVVSHTKDARKLKLPTSMTAHMSAEERRTAQLHAMILFRFRKRLAQVMAIRRRRKKEEAEREAALLRHTSIRHSTFRAGGLMGRAGARGGAQLRAVPTNRVRRGSSCGMDSDRSPRSARGLPTSARGASFSLGSGSGLSTGSTVAPPPVSAALPSSTATADPAALPLVSGPPHGGPAVVAVTSSGTAAPHPAVAGETGAIGGDSGSPAVLHKTSQAWHGSRPFQSSKLEVDWIAQPAPIPVPLVQRTTATSPERSPHSIQQLSTSHGIRAEQRVGAVLPRLREHLVHLLEDQRRHLQAENHGSERAHSPSHSRGRSGPRASIAVVVNPDSLDSSSFARAAVRSRTVACQVSDEDIAAALGIVQRTRPLVSQRSLLPPLPHAGRVFGCHRKKKNINGHDHRMR